AGGCAGRGCTDDCRIAGHAQRLHNLTFPTGPIDGCAPAWQRRPVGKSRVWTLESQSRTSGRMRSFMLGSWPVSDLMLKTKNAQAPPGEVLVIEETGLGPFLLRVRTGSCTFMVDEPIGSGGLSSGPDPYDLLHAAFAASAITTMRVYANQRKW